jgi:hypothetical protein
MSDTLTMSGDSLGNTIIIISFLSHYNECQDRFKGTLYSFRYMTPAVHVSPTPCTSHSSVYLYMTALSLSQPNSAICTQGIMFVVVSSRECKASDKN